MVIDSADYLGATDLSEKDEVAIINTDTADAEADQLVEAPRADDCSFPPDALARPCRVLYLHAIRRCSDDSLKELVLPPLPEEPPVLDDAVYTWQIEAWNSLSKKEHGPVFNAGGHPWCVCSPDPLFALAFCPASNTHCIPFLVLHCPP